MVGRQKYIRIMQFKMKADYCGHWLKEIQLLLTQTFKNMMK